MLYRALLAVDLPCTLGAPIPPHHLWDGVERLLMSGTWSRVPRRCEVSAGAVLVGSWRALRRVGAGPLEVRGDADPLFALTLPPEPGSDRPSAWAEKIPPAWERTPADLRVTATLSPGARLMASISLRFTGSPPDDQPALTGVFTLAWRPDLLPDPDASESAIRHALTVGGLRELQDRLDGHGDRAVSELITAFQEELRAPTTARAQTRVLAQFGAETARHAELISGLILDDADRDTVMLGIRAGAERAALEGTWPATSPDGVIGALIEGRFVAGAAEPEREVA